MKQKAKTVLAVWLLVLCFNVSLFSGSGPYRSGDFKGRIAYSTDGNYNDEDDWAANAVAIAILAEYQVLPKVVHFDFNSILPRTDPAWEEENRISVYGAADRFGLPRSVLYDCRRDLEGAINNIKKQINASSADDPLYFIVAGPMQVPARAILESDPSKRRYVYCISHNNWNDGYKSADLVSYNKRDVIPLGINWVQIQDQNEWLSTSPFWGDRQLRQSGIRGSGYGCRATRIWAGCTAGSGQPPGRMPRTPA